jgi:hypothetical protein
MTAMTPDLKTVTNHAGTPFRVRIVRVGECYGRDDCLTHGGAMYGRPAQPDALPMIEFYDARQDEATFGPRGQFVSRYYLDTIAECVREGRGINLDGCSPSWFVDADNVRDAFAWAAVELVVGGVAFAWPS